MGLSLEAPDHTTVSRRSKSLKAKLIPIVSKRPIHLIIDSTGLSIVGEGEWAAAKHGGRGKRGWRKLHIGVDGEGMIRAQVLTESSAAGGGRRSRATVGRERSRTPSLAEIAHGGDLLGQREFAHQRPCSLRAGSRRCDSDGRERSCGHEVHSFSTGIGFQAADSSSDGDAGLRHPTAEPNPNCFRHSATGPSR
ncbi:MAG: hypothetical protein ACJA2W_002828 [Planctomycetota bacterium]|jgi:hypothetical protein